MYISAFLRFLFMTCTQLRINMSYHEYTNTSEHITVKEDNTSQCKRDNAVNTQPTAGSSSSIDVISTERQPLISPSSSSGYYGATRPVSNREHAIQTPYQTSSSSRWRKTCTYIVTSIVVPIVFLLTFIFWFAPTYAERSVDSGVAFTFKRAAILNFTESNIIHMHISGEIGLQPSLYRMQQRLSRVFGGIGLQKASLRVHYQRSPSLSAQLMSFDQLSMGTVDIPALQLNDTSNVTSFDFITRFVINETDALIDFCKDAVVAKTVLWRISGPLSMNVVKLPWSLNAKLDKVIELEGMDGLRKTDLQSLMFPGPHTLGGISVTGIVGIYNPSQVLSFSLGDVDFGIYLPSDQKDKNDTQIAVVRASKAKLEGQQMNYFNVSGRTLPINSDDDASRKALDDFLTRYLHGNTTQVNVRGSSFGPDDMPSKKHVGNVPHWLEKALESISLRVPFPGATETQLIQSLELKDIKIDFSKEGDPLISGNAVAMLKKPEEMQFHMDVTEIDPHVFLYLNPDSEKPFANVQPDKPCPATTEEGNGIDLPLQTMRVRSKLVRAPFKVLPGGQKDFENFLRKVFSEKKGKIYIRGTSDATVDSDFGHLNIKDLVFNGEIETKGLQGLQHPPPRVTSMTISRGYEDALYVQTELDIYSPADVDINLGALNMALLYTGHVIGNTSIPELKMLPGQSNKLVVSAWLFGNNDHVIDFIGNYISRGVNSSSNNVTLTISGQHNNATKSVFLKHFLSRIKFDVQTPPFDEEPLLADCRMNILSSTVIMSLRNPFPGVNMTINKINASASYEEYEIGTMIANFEDPGEGWKYGPMKLPPPSCANGANQCVGVVVDSEKIPITTGKLGYEAIKKALGGSIEVSVASKVSVMIDNFKLDNLRYHQSNITAKVRKGF